MRVPSPAENATSRNPTTDGRVPISNTPGVQASRNTIGHVPHPSVRLPISDTPGVQASRYTIDHASLPQEPHINIAIVPVEVDTMPVARDFISWPDERTDDVDANPHLKGVMRRSENLARIERREEDVRRSRNDSGFVMLILRDNQDLHSAMQQRANAEAMQAMKDEQAQRDEVQLKVMLDLQAAVNAINNRREVSVTQHTATRSGGQTEDLLGDVARDREDN
jgi:hypothetical protein